MEYTDKPWFKTWWGILVIIFLAIALIFLVAIGFYIYESVKTAQKSSGVKLSGQQYDKASKGINYPWGQIAEAPITIVEFGDFACPHCQQAFPTIREISLKYKNDIKYIWRDYPLATEYSTLLALGARCANEQGLFWPMHDKLFLNQSVSSADQLLALTNQIGADTTRFNDCLNQQKYLTQIKKDLTDGQEFGISGTPTYFINGYKVEGNIPYNTFVKIIEELKK
ncbi:MAG: thioredoxin domain-containing protein [Patescibacteria group bacterium]|jgi:protein-disulfide isomerase